jgi:predicted LPLAT superfamily acyltransferase
MNESNELSEVQERRYHSEYYHQVAKIRKLSAYKFAKSAKYLEKSKKFKTKSLICTEKAVHLRGKTEPFRLKIKIEENKLRKLRSKRGGVVIAKHEYKIAKLKRKIETLEAKAAKYTAKSAKFKEKSTKCLEKSILCEKEGKALRDRADAMESVEGV